MGRRPSRSTERHRACVRGCSTASVPRPAKDANLATIEVPSVRPDGGSRDDCSFSSSPPASCTPTTMRGIASREPTPLGPASPESSCDGASGDGARSAAREGDSAPDPRKRAAAPRTTSTTEKSRGKMFRELREKDFAPRAPTSQRGNHARDANFFSTGSPSIHTLSPQSEPCPTLVFHRIFPSRTAGGSAGTDPWIADDYFIYAIGKHDLFSLVCPCDPRDSNARRSPTPTLVTLDDPVECLGHPIAHRAGVDVARAFHVHHARGDAGLRELAGGPS